MTTATRSPNPPNVDVHHTTRHNTQTRQPARLYTYDSGIEEAEDGLAVPLPRLLSHKSPNAAVSHETTQTLQTRQPARPYRYDSGSERRRMVWQYLFRLYSHTTTRYPPVAIRTSPSLTKWHNPQTRQPARPYNTQFLDGEMTDRPGIMYLLPPLLSLRA